MPSIQKLAYYDPTKQFTLQVGASSSIGLGTTSLQDKKPIAFASKSLTYTESRYANIERELLAVVYECEHFHAYLYGQRLRLEAFKTNLCFGFATLTTYLWFGHLEMISWIVLLLT